MGGVSAEREISLKTGQAVLKSLKRMGYDAAAVDSKDGNLAEDLKKKKIQVAFIALHGGAGEDGSVQGMLEALGIPYTGSGVLASALAMDKEASKKIFLYHKLPVPEFVVVRKGERPEIKFPLPWVVKPATEGSSIGVRMVEEGSGVGSALHAALKLSDRALVERRVYGKEVQVGILSGRVLGSVEVRPKKLDFYSYEAKYTSGATEYILPPELGKGALQRAEHVGLAAHNALGCKGATRVDLIVDKSGSPFVLEVNTIPGMTETSLLPKIARLRGLDFDALVTRILKEAVKA
jgi:D-alanine-D-alanine ligase